MNSASGRVEWPMVKNAVASADPCKGASLVDRDVIGLVALDLVLRIILARVVPIAFVEEVRAMHLDDLTADAAGFRVPADVTSDPEPFRHDRTSNGAPISSRGACPPNRGLQLKNDAAARRFRRQPRDAAPRKRATAARR